MSDFRKLDYGLVLVESLKYAPSAGVKLLDAKKIAKEHGLSPTFMEKVAQELRRAGWLEARRGLGGGYRLAKDVPTPEIISYFEKPYNVCPISRKLEVRN